MANRFADFANMQDSEKCQSYQLWILYICVSKICIHESYLFMTKKVFIDFPTKKISFVFNISDTDTFRYQHYPMCYVTFPCKQTIKIVNMLKNLLAVKPTLN